MKTWLTTQTVWLQIALIGLSAGGLMLGGTNVVKAEQVQRQPVLIAQSDRWSYQVRRELIKAAVALGLGGYNLTHDPFLGNLRQGGYQDITLNVRRGVSYAIVGVCDNDCGNIDLELYDDNGNLISSDVQRDDTPLVRTTPRWSAQFTVRVTMARCSAAPCRYGVGFFGK